jgi:hypothetical protein
MRRQFLYVYVCRKHLGWGTHFGYVGVTNRPDLRDLQHRADKPWADLIMKRHMIPLGVMPRLVAEALETVLIRVTLPVYNVKHNMGNPRRIKPYAAKQQRWARDGAAQSPWSIGLARRVLTARPNLFTLVRVAPLVAGALYLWSR